MWREAQNFHVLFEIHVSFAERTTTMVSKVDGIGRKPSGFPTPDGLRRSARIAPATGYDVFCGQFAIAPV